jgi:hypothetical protein
MPRYNFSSIFAIALLCITDGCCAPRTVPQTPANIDKLIDYLVSTIDDSPSVSLHYDYTRSVTELILIGEPAIGKILPLMEKPEVVTRMRACNALAGITRQMYKTEQEWQTFWISLGNLQAEQPLAERQHAIHLWNQWLRSREQTAPINALQPTATPPSVLTRP